MDGDPESHYKTSWFSYISHLPSAILKHIIARTRMTAEFSYIAKFETNRLKICFKRFTQELEYLFTALIWPSGKTAGNISFDFQCAPVQ